MIPNKRELDRLTWQDIKESIKEVNESFFNIVENINPSESLPLYVSSFKYGDLVGDESTFYLADSNKLRSINEYPRCSDVYKDLNYGANSFPLAMVMEKQLEWFITDDLSGQSIPVFIHNPGDFLNVGKALNKSEDVKHAPNGLMLGQAGVKSTFLLQKIGCKKSHRGLEELSQNIPISSDFHEHGIAFKVIQSETNYTAWQSKILYFSNKWIENITSNPDWAQLKKYLDDYKTSAREHISYYWHYMRMFSDAYRRINLSQNLFIQKVTNHLYEILVGGKLGFKPTDNSEGLPLETVKYVYSEHYKLKTDPIVMVPSLYNKNTPIYFSLNYPCFEEYDLSLRKKESKLSELDLLKKHLLSYKDLFSKPIKSCCGTLLEELSREANFRFCHNLRTNNKDALEWLSDIKLIKELDPIFNKVPDSSFPYESTFFQGCVSI
jgi:hypothetical protein